ncbi:MAG TPA: hypothetical protein VMG12_26980 [Polyangiaceae bacterium]|nr:hypothetical protein [Polyangiaceae bacterium]
MPTGRERFLAVVLDYAMTEGWRTSKDFLRHFGPRLLMESLARDDELRTRVLTSTTRVNERLAQRKTIASATEDLTLALEEGLTDADKLVALLSADDRVRLLDAAKLWTFLTEAEFWKGDANDAQERDRYVRRLTFIVERALEEGVLRLQDVADGIGFKRIATSLPRAELQRVVEHALSRAREGQRLTEEQLLEAVPLRALMMHVPLEHTWNEVIVGRLARPMQFIPPTPEEAARSRRMPPPPPSRSRSSVAPQRADSSLLPDSLIELQRGLERTGPPSLELEELVAVSAEDSEETQIHRELETRVDIRAHRDDDERRSSSEGQTELERVTESLRAIGRLPDPDPELTLPILLSIESMYAELGQSSDETERYTVVRDAFPNQNHLRVALLALIRLLDPGRRSAEGGLADADADLLIRTLLFEERHVGELDAMGANHHVDPGVALRPPLGQYS